MTPEEIFKERKIIQMFTDGENIFNCEGDLYSTKKEIDDFNKILDECIRILEELN